MTMIELRFTTGEEGRAVALDGDMLEVRTAASHPVGEPLAFALALADGPLALEGKSRGSRRLDDGAFEVRVRLVTLRRADRERLVSALR